MDFPKYDGRLAHPFSMIVAGPSGAGKSKWVIDFLINREKLVDTNIDYIVWCYGQKTATLQYIAKRFGKTITLMEGLPVSFDDIIRENLHGLIILDDLMSEATSSRNISDLFTKQSHHSDISVILILQNLYHEGAVRKTLYRNAKYLVLFKSPLDYTVAYSLAHKIFPKRTKIFLDIFKKATEKPYGYLFIDGNQKTPSSIRFRYNMFHPNYQEILEPIEH